MWKPVEPLPESYELDPDTPLPERYVGCHLTDPVLAELYANNEGLWPVVDCDGFLTGAVYCCFYNCYRECVTVDWKRGRLVYGNDAVCFDPAIIKRVNKQMK
jgi:hypothetical protein